MSARTWAREIRVLLEFAAGFCATIFFHQPMLWLLRVAGLTSRAPFDMKPVAPLGVPAVVSLAFWGGIWGLVMIPAIARVRNEAAYWVAALLFGAILPTLVAGFVVAPLKGQPLAGGGDPKTIMAGMLINGAWGVGSALLFRFFARSK
ncbi:MAG TPA: hypothetical protein VNL91_01315 [Thermoanaerobaculia bacterium]|nr:hypothetical protein [Thermoanaerobaculia bacterium]